MRSPNISASSMKCVVRIIVRPLRYLCKISQVCRRAAGSIPEVGSSNMITLIWKKNKNVLRTERHKQRNSENVLQSLLYLPFFKEIQLFKELDFVNRCHHMTWCSSKTSNMRRVYTSKCGMWSKQSANDQELTKPPYFEDGIWMISNQQ